MGEAGNVNLESLGGATEAQLAVVMEHIAQLSMAARSITEDLAFQRREASHQTMNQRLTALHALLGQIGWMACSHGGGEQQGTALDWMLPPNYLWALEEESEGGES